MGGQSVTILALAACALCGCEPADVELSPGGGVATPADALARVRGLRADGRLPPDRPATIAVSPGRYFVGDGLRLTAEDSNVRFVGAGPEACIFDGGERLSKFRVLPDGTWEADAPTGLEFDQLWVNGRRAVRARSPNDGWHYMADMDNDEPRKDFFVETGVATQLAALSGDELQRVRFQIWQNWDTGYVTVESVDAATGHVVGHNRLMWPFFRSVRRETPRYVVENYRAALDAPGEWYHDRARGRILYLPLAGEDANETVAVVPRASEILLVSGAHDVTFEKVGFEHSGWRIGRDGVANLQSAYLTTNAAVVVERSRRVDFLGVRISRAGAHGVWFADGAEDSSLVHSLVEDVGACGVRIGPSRSAARHAPSSAEIARRIRVEDSIVRAGGREEEGASGVLLTHAADCEIAHNDVYDFFYTGISVGWTWGYAPTSVRNNRIVCNNLHHLNQGRLADMAGVYTLGDGEGTVVLENWIHDIVGYRHTFPTWGLYADEGSHGILFVSNLVERCAEAGLHQNYGRGNVFDGNVFLGFDRHGFRRSRHEEHLSATLLNNVFVWDDPSVPLLEPLDGRPVDDLAFSNNVAWCRGGMPTNLTAGVRAVSRVDLSFAEAIRKMAGIRRSDSSWAHCADEVTWRERRSVPAPPRFRSRSVIQDFERLPVGVFRPKKASGYGRLNVHADNPETFAIEMSGSNRFLRVVEARAERSAWAPHLYIEFCYFDCVVSVSFRIRIGRGARVGCVVRDYSVSRDRPGAFTPGCTLRLDDGDIPRGEWVDVRLTLDLPRRRWMAEAGDWRREGVFSDETFKAFTWLGFTSEGKPGSEWWIDDLKIERQGGVDAP